MAKFLSRERFGQPQVLAAILLLVFAGECSWLLLRDISPLDVNSLQLFRVEEGMRQWHGGEVAGTPSQERLEAASSPPGEIVSNQGYDPDHSPVWYLLASSAFTYSRDASEIGSVRYWGWLARFPYLVCGLLLGASLWYVSRRLYGNAGGYIALTLYCFSPAAIRGSTLWFAEPEMAAAWGAFGAVFTSIAVAHTLYAPREVVLWNWRRILLLGLSLVLAIGCQFSLVILIPVSLAFLLYVVPQRRMAALGIWAAACAVASVLLYVSYGLHPGVFLHGLGHAEFFPLQVRAFAMPGAYQHLWQELVQCGPAALLALPVAIVTYVLWPRTRYFGNTAPLLMAVMFLLLSLGMPHRQGAFVMVGIPFLFVFVSGIAADLLESRQRGLTMACVWGLLAASALWNLAQLARVGNG
jgi:hypothetical protein